MDAATKRIGCTGKAIITSGRAIAVACFSRLDKIIGASRGTVVVVKVIAPWSATPISRSAGDDW